MEVSKHVDLPVTTLIGFGGLYNKTFTCVTSTPSLILFGQIKEATFRICDSFKVLYSGRPQPCLCKTKVEVIEGD
jgi:hypothetical protein